MNVTPYRDVDELLAFFTQGVVTIFGEALIGVYLTGSLSYDAFDYESSDIDVTVILAKAASLSEVDVVRSFHTELQSHHGKWAKRLECSYTPVGMLPSVLPPKEPRPWYWGDVDILYAEAAYGNEWIINKYFLYECAIPLIGPPFGQLTGPVDIREVQQASVRDLFTEWEPKTEDRTWFRDSHYEAYFVLNLCRILYTVVCGKAGSKQAAATWVKRTYGEPWQSLVATAEQWQHGMILDLQEQAMDFLWFAIDRVLETQLAREMAEEIRALRHRSSEQGGLDHG